MAQDLNKLASQGRAYSPARPWTEAELELLIAIERHGDVSRMVAADYIRNGIASVEEYLAAVEADFVPSDQAALQAEAVKAHTEKVRKELNFKETEEVSEPEAEADTSAETEEVAEPEEVPKPKKKAAKK